MSEINSSQQTKSIELRDSLANNFKESEAKEFMDMHKDSSWYNDFMTLYEMIISPTYTISTQTKITIAGTLAYVILPIDVIPDFLPVVGWLDDAFVLSFTINALKQEIDSFKNHKNSV